ncbi:MAG: cation:proton antiporter [Solirubrobacterales bacterium]
MDEILLGLSLVVVLAILARLLATVIQVPAIVPLLVIGVLAGTSVTGLIDPEKLLGDALSPVVQIAVGLILFEGALSLKREELAAGVQPAVIRLVTLGVLITWVIATLSVIWLFDVPHPIGVLIGAVVIVSGPTVVIPILDFINPSVHVRSVLKWEGILIDPIGAIIAVVVFGSLAAADGKVAIDLVEIVLSLASGALAGAVGAFLLMPILGTRKLAARDKVAATLMMVVASFAAADALFTDSGLVATIVMGLVLANQKRVKTDYIVEFKETLVPILIGILFILLAANVDVATVIDLGWRGLVLVAILVLIVRPLAVLTTLGLPFGWQERTFFAAMAPRGIVAASTASAFGLSLTQEGVKGAEMIIPVTFFVIVGTVFIYALGSPWLARTLGLSGEQPPSLIFLGAPHWAVALGAAVNQAGAEVRFWTDDEARARDVEESGMVAFGGPLDPHSDRATEVLESSPTVVMASEDDTLNQSLAFQLAEIYEPDQIYRLRSPEDQAPIMHSTAMLLFESQETVDEIDRRLAAGESMKVLEPGEQLPEGAMPLASIKQRRGASPAAIRIASTDFKHLIGPTARLVALAPPGSV